MTVLVTGGAGYIGSHMVHALVDRGERVVVLDDLSTGIRAQVPEAAVFVLGNVGDATLLRQLLPEHGIDAVVHFAGSIVVPDSVADPLAYYANNTVASRTLIAACVAAGIRRFVFSSTAAVYGIPKQNPVTESVLLQPINPYGRSKLMTEWMLEDTSRAHDFRYVALRYFNVAGADPKGRTGQSTPRATHLIKRACQVALGRVDRLDVFGTDFPTRDGTGVRDYIHVSDLADAHALALDHLAAGGASHVLNCGYGRGFSVREVIRMVERVAGRALPVREAARRAGDPPELVADSSRLKAEFRWQPKRDDLEQIVASAYAWEGRLDTA
jgi:UDP-glucose 4-epimerase